MSNFFLDMAEAVANTDDSLRNSYIKNGTATIFWAFSLMKLHSEWQPILDKDTSEAVLAAVTPKGAGLAAYYKSKYEIHTQQKDTQCNVWQSLIQAGQVDINNDSDSRKGNFKLADGLASTSSVCNSLLINIQ